MHHVFKLYHLAQARWCGSSKICYSYCLLFLYLKVWWKRCTWKTLHVVTICMEDWTTFHFTISRNSAIFLWGPLIVHQATYYRASRFYDEAGNLALLCRQNVPTKELDRLKVSAGSQQQCILQALAIQPGKYKERVSPPPPNPPPMRQALHGSGPSQRCRRGTEGLPGSSRIAPGAAAVALFWRRAIHCFP